MHYVEEGAGDPILLLHGEPTWGVPLPAPDPGRSRPSAASSCPDLFGFGRSDKPVDQAAYSYDTHARSIERLALEARPRELTLVVHDWGGPIGLRFAVTHPERVARLVILNTGVGVGAPSEPWLRFRALVREVGAGLHGEPARAGRVRLATRRRRGPRLRRAVPGRRRRRRARSPFRSSSRPSPTTRPPPRCSRCATRSPGGRSRRSSLFSDSDRVFSPAHAERHGGAHPGRAAGRDRHRRRRTSSRRTGARRSPRGSRASSPERLTSIVGRKVASPRSGGAP